MADTPAAGSAEAAARFVESKHRRDQGGKFSRSGAGSGGASPGSTGGDRQVTAGQTVHTVDGRKYRIAGRTRDGRVVVVDDDLKLHTVKPGDLSTSNPAAEPALGVTLPEDPRDVPKIQLGAQLGDVIDQLRADGVPVWEDVYGQVSALWQGRQLDLHGTRARS